MRIVLDTNVVISGFLWEGRPAEVMRRVEAGEVEMYLSAEILEEIEKVLEKDKLKAPIGRSGQDIKTVISKIVEMVV